MSNLKTLKLKGGLRKFFIILNILAALLVIINIIIAFIDIRAALILLIFTVAYILSVIFFTVRNRSLILNELVSFATQYGQVQRRLLRDLKLPYALLDETGKVVWTNNAFKEAFSVDRDFKKSLTSLFPNVNPDSLPTDDDENGETTVSVEYDGRNYRINMRRISMSDMVSSSDVIEPQDTYSGCLTACFFYDDTALKIALQEIDDQSIAVGLIYLDNYEEALESVEEVRRSLLIALIDRKVNKYISALDGICKKIEKDKFLVIMRKKALESLKESKFDLLQDVKTVNIGNEMAVTLSMGIGLDGLSYAQNYEFARNAIDMALGRGGDQAVVKTPDDLSYYGGKSQQVEKSTRVKARVKAQALMEIISGRDEVYIMGHRNGDEDSFGAAVGMYRIVHNMDKPAHIVLNDVAPSLQPLVDLFMQNPEYEEGTIISGSHALEWVGSNAALIIVDVNKPSITECPDLIKYCKSIVVLDHHRQGQETVENATLSYVEAYASSACELVCEILQYTTPNGNTRIRPEEADCMYAGMVIDTNNFTSKTGVRTFEAAAYLRRNGADVVRVRKLFRDDAAVYKARADIVSQAEIYHDCFAISSFSDEDAVNPLVIGAQAANELLNIRGIKASFVLTQANNMINISARSIDEINVQVIMEKMGGGGHMNMAACQLNVPLEEAYGALKGTLDSMIEDGEIEL
ncbi:MAG: DHH family phosphoesterase [Lachnospiraceae bacterium]|nr:DHH family phosphoesterase [Lachnospiraceae bacterium]